MTAAVGFPTLRLVRIAIGDWTLGELQPGQHQTRAVNLPRQDTRSKPNARRP
jgi:23S rRNA pseudouridine2457 synthase